MSGRHGWSGRIAVGTAAVLAATVLATGCGVRSTQPVALNDTVPPTAAPATTTYRFGTTDVSVRMETVSSRIYFVSGGRLEFRIRAIPMPRLGDAITPEQANFIKSQRKQAVIDALLAGPTESEREDGLSTSVNSLLDVQSESPAVVSAIEAGTQTRPVSLKLAEPPGNAEEVLLAYGQLVWTLDPEGENGTQFSSITNGEIVTLNPPRDEGAGASTGSIVFGEDYSCLVYVTCAVATPNPPGPNPPGEPET
jgi:hypothetical protein